MTGALGVLWRFGRPHTVIGTTLSVLSLQALALHALDGADTGRAVGVLGLTLVAALCVNVFIVGINQIEDVEIDRINKPDLPLAAGDMTRTQAQLLVGLCALVPMALAVTQGLAEVLFVGVALLVGVAYSSPPLRLKRFPVLASLCISGVRGVVVNLGVFLHVVTALGAPAQVSGPAWAVTGFVLPFSFAIAILKDVPDVEGDRRYGIGTFSVRFGGARVTALGMAVLAAAYLAMAALGPVLLDDPESQVVWVLGHLGALGALVRLRRGTRLDDHGSYWRFYMGVWKLFFAEYALVAVAVLV